MTGRSGFRTLLAAALLFGTVGVGTAQAHPHDEDDPSWNCTVDGNRICGPGNANRAAPGRYVDGVLVDPWPTCGYGIEVDGVERNMEAPCGSFRIRL